MKNSWFRLYSEFATDSKIQSLSETLQRRFIMLLCLKSSDELEKLDEDELAFSLRITPEELQETKKVFLKKGFIDENWNILNWDKRQFVSDKSTERVRAYRLKNKDLKENNSETQSPDSLNETACNDNETLQKRRRNVTVTPPDTDTDTDTDTDQLSSLRSDNLNTDSLRSSVVEKKSKTIAEKIPIDEVKQVFEHWKSVMRHPNAALDEKRKRYIKTALKMGYSVEKLCLAIDGCSKTPHNIGMNEQGQRYDGLHIILRNADQIDRFIHNSHDPPKIKTKGDFALQANIQAGQSWLNKKMQQAENARTFENEK